MKILLLAALLTPWLADAQPYSIDWHKVAAGGSDSGAGGAYSLAGTIGQHDASNPVSGGRYTMTGGYWSMVSVVQTPGVPNLIIVVNGPHSVSVLWPDTGSYTLQQNANLVSGSWTPSSLHVTTANGTNSVTISPPTGRLFFRLSSP